MAKSTTTTKNISGTRTQPPAKTPEGREQQLISLALEAVEKRIRDGTASAQELVHFLKAGSPNARIERRVLEKQEELLDAKIESFQSQKRVEELYADALSAMRAYSGELAPDDQRFDD